MDESGENLATCSLEKLFFLSYFDVLTKTGFPLASCGKVRQWKAALGLF